MYFDIKINKIDIKWGPGAPGSDPGDPRVGAHGIPWGGTHGIPWGGTHGIPGWTLGDPLALGTHWPLGTHGPLGAQALGDPVALGDPLALGDLALGAWGPWAPPI